MASHGVYVTSELNRMADPAEFAGEHYQYCHPAVTAEILAGQHAVRAWEYSQALRALEAWERTPRAREAVAGLTIADVGGAGSHFWKALARQPRALCIDVLDPAIPQTADGVPGELLGESCVRAVSTDVALWTPEHREHYHAVFCLSVIEHVADPQPFVQQLVSLVCPGGLLVLTCDAGEHGDDRNHFHWMRKWIAYPAVLDRLALALYNQGMRPLGATPHFVYRGPVVYDYTVASLACRKD